MICHDGAGRAPYQQLVASVAAHDMSPDRCYRGGRSKAKALTDDERWLEQLVNVARSHRYEAFRRLVKDANAFAGAVVELVHVNGAPIASIRYADGSRRSVRVDPETGRPI
jgi:hypothetical protein